MDAVRDYNDHNREKSYDWILSAEGHAYSATLTGNPFLWHESRIVCAMLATTDAGQIRMRVVAENTFQYRTTKSIPKRVNALIARLGPVPAGLRHFIATAPPAEARMVLVLILAVRDRLFREFMAEVFAPKAAFHDETLTDTDFRRFFERKIDADMTVAGWRDEARTKLRTNMTAALVDAGLLDGNKTRRVIRPVLDPDTHDALRHWFPPHYIALLEGVR